MVFVELSYWSSNLRIVYVRTRKDVAGVHVRIYVLGRGTCVRASCVVPYSNLPLKCTESPLAVEV